MKAPQWGREEGPKTMNTNRRKEIAAVQDTLAQLLPVLEDQKALLEGLRDEEQEYLDNMPESFQNGDKGEAAQAAVEALDEAVAALDEFIDSDFDSRLNDAQE